MTFVLLLTGASTGIGAAIAQVFLRKSPQHCLVAVARSKDKLEALKAQYPDQVAVVAGDVADEALARTAVRQALQDFGRLDAVIANAGVLDPVGPIAEANIADWKRLYDVNFFSVVALAREAIPELRRSHGKFIAVSSGASTSHYSGWGAYGSSKAALNSFIGALAESEPIEALSVAPGVVNTGMQKDIRDTFSKNMRPEVAQKFFDFHSNNQLLEPEVPATVYVNLALRGFKPLSGQYLRFNDEALHQYIENAI